MAQKLESRKSTPLTDEEREAWSLFVQWYRHIEAETRTGNPIRHLRAVIGAWNRRRSLEARGNQALLNFERQVKAQIAEDQDGVAIHHAEREELMALRNEVGELRKALEQLMRRSMAR